MLRKTSAHTSRRRCTRRRRCRVRRRSAGPRGRRGCRPARRAGSRGRRPAERRADQPLEQHPAEAAALRRGAPPARPPRASRGRTSPPSRCQSTDDAPARVAESAPCLRGVHRQLVEGEAEDLRRVGRQLQGRPSTRISGASGSTVCDRLAPGGSRSSAPDHDSATRRSCAAAMARSRDGEVADEGVDVGRRARGLARHRLHHREQVLRAVGQLAHHEPHLLLVRAGARSGRRRCRSPPRRRRPRRSSARGAGRRSARSPPTVELELRGVSRAPLSITRRFSGASLRRSRSANTSASVRPRKSSGPVPGGGLCMKV